jgi:MFS family permease
MTQADISAAGHHGEAAWPSPLYGWYVVGVLLLASTLSFIDRMILSLMIGPIRNEFGISDTQVSLLIGFAFVIFYSFMGLPLGRIADRGNRRNLIAGGIGVWSLMTAACGMATGFWTLFLARIGVGVGEAALGPSAFSILSDYFPKEKLGRVIAVYSIGIPLGAGIALVAGAYVIQAVSGLPPVDLPILGRVAPWQLTFFAVGLPGLLVALLMFTVREPVRRDLAPDAHAAPFTDVFRFIVRHPRTFTAHFGGLALLSFVMYGQLTWVPSFLERTYGMPITDAGYFYGAIHAVCGAGGLIAGGILVDRMFARGQSDAHLRVVRLCMLLMLPFFVAAPLMPTAELAILLLIPGTFLSAIQGGSASVALRLITPNHLRGQMIALYGFIVTLVGLGLGPTMIAAVTEYGFGHSSQLRYAMSLVPAILLPISMVLISWGLPHFRRSVALAGL